MTDDPKDSYLKDYLGGKNGEGVYQTIINLIPPHVLYVEGFTGTGAIYRNKLAAEKTILLDKHQECLSYFTESDSLLLLNVCTLDWLENIILEFGPTVVIYLDPPYHPDTRKSDHVYVHEFTVEDHERLLRIINQPGIRCYIVLSGYRNDCTTGKPIELYESQLDKLGWWSMDFQATTRGGVSTETLWCNYTPSDLLHDYQYFGDDKRKRQDADRAVKSMVGKVRNFNRAQQLSVYAELTEILAEGSVELPTLQINR